METLNRELEQSIERFRQELPAFREMTKKFYEKEVSVKDYKGFSGRYGSYAQRGAEASMLRLRMSGGRVTKDKLKFVADSIAACQINRVHFTTCQTIQLHNLDQETVCSIMEAGVDHGIITWGGGGDFPRNVMVSPLSGVERGEYFDVMPYALAAADYLLTLVDQVKMPRKLKVGFSNSPSNVSHATFRDLGFVARPDGTFDVYSAGGLGNNPKMGVCVAHRVEPSEILYEIRTMIEVFMAYGNYENRGRARTRYMQDTLGRDGYAAAYEEKRSQVRERFAGQLDLDPEQLQNWERYGAASQICKAADGTMESCFRVIPQKQDGLYAVAYHPPGGSPSPEKLGELYEVIRDMDQTELRLSPDEGAYIINCTAKEAKRVLEATKDSAENVFETSVACIGASICQVGVRDSQGMLQHLLDAMKEEQFGAGALPQIHISGCPSSCGTHQIGTLGFHGGARRVDGVMEPAFTLHVNGADGQDQARFGESLGVMLERDIPKFLKKVGRAVSASGVTFEEWYPEHSDQFREMAGEYIR